MTQVIESMLLVAESLFNVIHLLLIYAFIHLGDSNESKILMSYTSRLFDIKEGSLIF
jgi:hypothetical protein